MNIKLSFLIIIFIFSQLNNIASQTTDSDSIVFFELIDSANFYFGKEYKKSKNFADQAFNFAKSIDYKLGLGQSAYSLSRIIIQHSHYVEADSLLNYSINLFLKPANEKYLSMCFLQKGYMNITRSELDSAEYYINKAILLDIKTGDEDGLSFSYNNLGTVEEMRGNYEKAINLYQNGLNLFEKLDNKEMASNTYNNISILYYNLSRIHEAINAQKKPLH